MHTPLIEAEPDALLAARLIERTGAGGLVFAARSTARATRIHDAAKALAGEVSVGLLPAWDCLPFDRVSPSPEIMGMRMTTLRRLAGDGPHLLIAPIAALVQRVAPGDHQPVLRLAVGETVAPDAAEAALRRLGYGLDDEAVDRPGEAVVGAAVIDVFPGGGTLPCRIRHEDCVVTAIDRYDPATQRSRESIPAVVIGPVSEVVLEAGAERGAGIEHFLPDHVDTLTSPLALLPHAGVVTEPDIDDLVEERLAQIADSRRARAELAQAGAGALPPDSLYLDDPAWRQDLAGRSLVAIAEPEDVGGLPFATTRKPEEEAVAFVRARLDQGGRVAVAGGRLRRLFARRLGREPVEVAGWRALCETKPGSFAALPRALDRGFVCEQATVIGVADVFGAKRRRAPAIAAFSAALRPGDAVVHLDHGMARLVGLETVTSGAPADAASLEFAASARLLVPAAELDRVWRYGAGGDGVTLDRLDGDAWAARRAEIEREVEAIARGIVAMAAERAERTAPVLRPPRRAFDRFAAGFTFTPTEDQATAIDAVLEDLASGRPMDRLVCGDVGFGKTEVALRAAAAAVLSGKQVAVLAPTTVLVRQHAHTFARRFARLGIEVASLSRLTPAPEAKRIRADLAAGRLRLVIGTQALTGKEVRFAELGLLIVDEEQRFGVRQKAMLRKLGAAVHALTLTATPIPRTLQAALAGLQELSVLTTPPAARQPVRTAVLPYDDAVAAGALARERRRGGQSFVVCPRIEDLAPLGERLRAALPGLDLIVAHGGMKANDLDEAMTRFAEGDGEVLLSTDIIESGLDIPRANTILVWRAERFGLAQLHQLRGRVGRGRVRGGAWLFNDPDAPPGRPALARLRALEQQDRLGGGFSIAARDLDLRGAGDLLGAEQAGHVNLVGLELYQHWLSRALAAANGEAVAEEWTPELALDVPTALPADYVPTELARLDLLMRLARGEELDALEEEIADRYGALPAPVVNLLALARLRATCRALGVARLDVGPAAAAAAPRDSFPDVSGLERREARLLLPGGGDTAERRLAAAQELLAALERGLREQALPSSARGRSRPRQTAA